MWLLSVSLEAQQGFRFACRLTKRCLADGEEPAYATPERAKAITPFFLCVVERHEMVIVPCLRVTAMPSGGIYLT